MSRSNKDSGAYDLGELDQALFLYLDGQADPSSVQDQRRELSQTLLIFFFSPFKIQKEELLQFPFTFRFVFGDSLFWGQSHQKHVQLNHICSTVVLPLTRSSKRNQKGGKKILE